jgi:uncharacterized membrane protein YciS (DUF1049 family)
MKFIKTLLYLLIAVVMVALGAMFAVQNEATVPLNLLVVELPERSVALWVLLAFAVGGVLGMLTSLGVVLRLRASLLAANRRLHKRSSNKPVTTLPAAPAASAGEGTANA